MYSWRSMPYHLRLFVWLFGYTVLLFVCFSTLRYRQEKRSRCEALDAGLQMLNGYILSKNGDTGFLTDFAFEKWVPFNDLRISLIDTSGKVLFDNSLDSLPSTNHLDREEIALALRRGRGFSVRRHSESTGNYYFYSATKGENGLLVRTAVPYSVGLDDMLRADYGFVWIMGVVTLLLGVLGFLATKRLGLNISRLNHFAESMEKGEWISETEPFPHDELGDISNHIVRLYARLQQANAERDREHRAAVREAQEKERIKKQLTNNINHELKTPVAAIQVCVETLLAHENLDEDKRREFLQRCLSSTERLKKLLADVSLITRMEDGSDTVAFERLDLGGIVGEVCEEKRLLAQGKGIQINNRIETGLYMEGNASLLASVFENLIDNAIAYSGGTEIVLAKLFEDGQSLALSVADNGSGVEDIYLPHIFERFYRIDKGRSRAVGGTGLGLSIVKNAVLLHGGGIKAGNRRDGGLSLQITLAKHHDNERKTDNSPCGARPAQG